MNFLHLFNVSLIFILNGHGRGYYNLFSTYILYNISLPLSFPYYQIFKASQATSVLGHLLLPTSWPQQPSLDLVWAFSYFLLMTIVPSFASLLEVCWIFRTHTGHLTLGSLGYERYSLFPDEAEGGSSV